MSKEFTVIEVTPSGKRVWMGGAWCLVWVYSTKGNFMLKGFIKECEKYIEENGLKCWAIFNLYHTKKERFSIKNYRTIIRTYKCDFEIGEPNYITSRKNKTSESYKFRIYDKGNWRNGIFVKRLPGQFVNFNPPKFESAKSSLGQFDALKNLKDKLDKN